MLFDDVGGRFAPGARADADLAGLVFNLNDDRRHAGYTPRGARAGVLRIARHRVGDGRVRRYVVPASIGVGQAEDPVGVGGVVHIASAVVLAARHVGAHLANFGVARIGNDVFVGR